MAPSHTPWCSTYWKENLRVTLDYGRQLYLLIILWPELGVQLNFKILRNFMRPILYDEALFVHKLLRTLKFYSVVRFPINHISYSNICFICASSIYLHIIWLTVSVLSLHYHRLLLCSVLSIFALIWFIHETIVRAVLRNIFNVYTVGWVYRIHRLHLCWGFRESPEKYPGYDIKQSDGESVVMLNL